MSYTVFVQGQSIALGSDRHIGQHSHITFWPQRSFTEFLGYVYYLPYFYLSYFLERTTSLASYLVNQSEAMTMTMALNICVALNIAEFESIALVALLASLLPYNSLRTGTQTAIIRITNCAANSQNCFQYPTNQSMPQRTWWPCLQLAGQYFQKIVVHT